MIGVREVEAVRSLSHWERGGVRGSGLSIGSEPPHSSLLRVEVGFTRLRPPNMRADPGKPGAAGERERTESIAPLCLLAAIVLLITLALPATAQPMRERLAPCLACPGENGQSQTPDGPSLRGQPARYLLAQLIMFPQRLRPGAPVTTMLQRARGDRLRATPDATARI